MWHYYGLCRPWEWRNLENDKKEEKYPSTTSCRSMRLKSCLTISQNNLITQLSSKTNLFNFIHARNSSFLEIQWQNYYTVTIIKIFHSLPPTFNSCSISSISSFVFVMWTLLCSVWRLYFSIRVHRWTFTGSWGADKDDLQLGFSYSPFLYPSVCSSTFIILVLQWTFCGAKLRSRGGAYDNHVDGKICFVRTWACKFYCGVVRISVYVCKPYQISPTGRAYSLFIIFPWWIKAILFDLGTTIRFPQFFHVQ